MYLCVVRNFNKSYFLSQFDQAVVVFVSTEAALLTGVAGNDDRFHFMGRIICLKNRTHRSLIPLR